MAQPTRDEAATTLEEGQTRIDELTSKLNDDQLTRSATIGGGDWSAADLIGHLATWEAVALRSLQEFRGGEMPWIETDDGPFSAPVTGKIDAFNAQSVAENRTRSPDQIRENANSVHRQLVDAIRTMSDEEWTAKATYPTPEDRRRKLVTLLGSILGAPQRPFGHAFAHIPDLEEYVRAIGL